MVQSPPLTIRAGVNAGDITWASGHRAALHGTVESAWAVTPEGGFTHNVTIPANGLARVLIPSRNGAAGVTESGGALSSSRGVTIVGEEVANQIGYVELRVLSGSYRFASGWRRAQELALGEGPR